MESTDSRHPEILKVCKTWFGSERFGSQNILSNEQTHSGRLLSVVTMMQAANARQGNYIF
jgi:hypothetical protein